MNDIYIADSIGTEYKEWKLGNAYDNSIGNTIFISSPTGSGKTYFILNIFLPYLAEKRKRLLYLVNRTILKEQLEKEIDKLEPNLSKYIRVELYQTIEHKIAHLSLKDKMPYEYFEGYHTAVQNIDPQNLQKWMQNAPMPNKYIKKDYFADGDTHLNKYKEYDCVVCDEAHYFLMDSNYNTNTILSYNFVKHFFGRKLRIYISATIDSIKKFIENDIVKSAGRYTWWFGFCTQKSDFEHYVRRECKMYPKYPIERNYDYIDINILQSQKEIVNIVVEGTEKWLIFVDNIKFGKDLEKDIKKSISQNKEQVAFITSDYRLNNESKNEVDAIVRNKKISARVLITTSVLDNGISIEDDELRNVIIIADTETEFIQMLGRKRNDKKPLKLYIYKLDKSHFARRQEINQTRLRIADDNYKTIEELIQPKLDRWAEKYEISLEWNTNWDYEAEFTAICMQEEGYIESQHKLLLQKMMNNPEYYNDIRTSFLAYEGVLRLNLLSLENLENLKQFYLNILEEFEKTDGYGEDAFLYKQLEWLNKPYDEAKAIIMNLKKSRFEKSKENLIAALEEIEKNGEPLTHDEAVKLKNELKNDLIELVKAKGSKEYLSASNKNERPISSKFMDYLRENCGIPFEVSVKNSEYTIRRVDIEK